MGRVAATSIDKYLGGDGEIEQKYIEDEEEDPFIGREDGFAEKKRAKSAKLAVEKRFPGFPLVELGLTEEAAVKEAKRCLRCQLRLHIDQPPLPPKKKEKPSIKK